MDLKYFIILIVLKTGILNNHTLLKKKIRLNIVFLCWYFQFADDVVRAMCM